MQYTTKIKNLESKQLIEDVNEEQDVEESIAYAETIRRQLEKINKRSIKMDIKENEIIFLFDK